MQLAQRLPFDRIAGHASRFARWMRSLPERWARALRAMGQRAALSAQDESLIDRTRSVSKLRGLS